ncbi:MAG: 30S ribosomal protein S12 methylthiotransferase RimO [Clostridia bacterium]|nr:30S ribosomal protein S12 methylthiotransferase RimO [Clostridia bacterium]
MLKISLASLGCSKNLVDAEQMLGIINEKGWEIMENEEDADVMVVNTCAFIESAIRESLDCIFELISQKKKDSHKKLIVTGCMAQRYKEDILSEIPEVDAVVGTNDFHKIAEVIENLCEEKVVLCSGEERNIEGLPRMVTTPAYTAYIKIADGCDNKCTYCAIPSIRGKYRSRKIEDIVAEAEKLAEDGTKELIVIAQDTTRYGMDIYGEYKLSELLRELCKIEKLKWVRVHYCYPELVDEDLVRTFKEEEKICNYFDIPIQHSSDKILKRMGRRTNREQLVKMLELIRTEIPDAIIRTSLITGFPGETEEDFEDLLDFVKYAKFDRLGVFAYSQEEGTPAAKLDNQVDDEEKIARQEGVMLLQAEISEELNRKKIGQTLEVLVEGRDEIIKSYFGRTYGDSIDIDGKVFFKSENKLNEGDLVSVLINESLEYDLFGEEI